MAGMRPENLYDLNLVGDPRVSPDGKRIAFVVTRFDRERNQYPSQIWLASTHGSEPPRPFTSGEHREMRPRWSPDGERIAFVSHRRGTDKECQLRVIPASGGESRRLAKFEEEIEDLAWSPDGGRIAFLVRDREEERYGKEKDKDRSPRRIDRIIYRLDNVGWTIDRRRHLFVIDTESPGDPVRLTDEGFEDSGLAWSPDGEQIAFASGRHQTWDRDLATDIFVVSSAGGDPEQLTQTGPGYAYPSFSADGSMIAFMSDPTPMDSPRHGLIGVFERATRQARILTEVLDRNATPYPVPRETMWVGNDVYFLVENSGSAHLYRAQSDGAGKPELVLGGERWVTGFDFAAGTLAFTATSSTQTPDLFVLDGTEERRITHFAEDFADKVSLSVPERFTATSENGTEVEAWVMPPSDFDPSRRYPALFNIHGGPFTQYGNKLFDEFQVYSGAGYAVIYSNPRGSSGYAEAWGRAIRGPKAPADAGSGWGGVDYQDLMAVVDEAIRRFPWIDADQIGVIGGSYGGYMTSWIVGHTDRFKAACSERACNNLLSMSWTADFGPFFQSYLGVTHLEDPEEYLRQSPITYAQNIKTPLLILHSDSDLRCPIEQAEQLFVALKLLDREVEFVRFPGESHELSRSGAPNHRVERFQIILEFFDRYLKT